VTVGSVIGTSSAMILYYQVISKNRFVHLNLPVYKLKKAAR
jgi:hypothetical protein